MYALGALQWDLIAIPHPHSAWVNVLTMLTFVFICGGCGYGGFDKNLISEILIKKLILEILIKNNSEEIFIFCCCCGVCVWYGGCEFAWMVHIGTYFQLWHVLLYHGVEFL